MTACPVGQVTLGRIERVLDTVLGRQQAMLRAVVVGLRLGNNYLGGLTWVVLGD